MIVWKNNSDTIVLEPIEIRGKRGVKKMKKTNSAIYIPNMDAEEFDKICAKKGLQFIYTPVQPHGRLVDADRLGLAMMDAANADQALAMVDDAPTVIEAEEGE